MTLKDFAKLKKEKSFLTIKSMYANRLIKLTSKQINYLIEKSK